MDSYPPYTPPVAASAMINLAEELGNSATMLRHLTFRMVTVTSNNNTMTHLYSNTTPVI